MQKQSLAYTSMAAALMCAALSAQGQSLDKTFTAFTACDASFFTSMAADKATWQTYAELESNNNLAWIKTKNRKAEDGNVLELSNKPTVAGLTLTHYLDESSTLGLDSHFYYWGFKVAGTLETVAEKIKPLVYDNQRLRKDGDVFVRTELKLAGKPWLRVPTLGGKVPPPMTIERAFLIETDTDLPNTVKVLCSLQGALSADVLQELRPDIAPKDFPEALDPELFNKVQASDEVMTAIQTVAQRSPLWTPKFKRVTYTNKRDQNETSVALVNTGDGLIEITENYTLFTVHRQSLAGLVQTKSRFNTSGIVYRAEKMDLNLPNELKPGETLSFQQTSQSVPTDVTATGNSFGLTCVVGDAFDASKIFTTLPGRAIALQCKDEKGKALNKAFLEALGLVIEYTPASSFFGSAKPTYTRFNIEQ